MSDKKVISLREWITIASFVIVTLGYGAKFVLMSDQVKRNKAKLEMVEKELKDANIVLLNHRLEQIEIKLDKIVTYMLKE